MSKLLANQIANFGDDAPIEIKEGLNIPAGKPLQAAGVVGNSGQVLSSTGSTIQWVTPFSGSYNDLTNRPTIPAAQVASDWNATSGVSAILNKPVVPAQPSVTTATAGTAALSYNTTNGEFTFTPPDLSGYATTASVANSANWDAAYSWGDHSTEGYLVATATDKANWNSAYGWGDHATQGYLTSYTETTTLQDAISRGNTSSLPAYFTNKLYFSNAFGTLTDLQAVNAATYHGMFAHAHDTGHGYFAHAGGWTQLIDEASSIDELGDVDTTTTAPSDGYVLKWEASSGSWKPAPDLVGTSNAGITLADLSVNNATASATPSLSYSNTTGVFTYTPYDPSTYTETDPVFTSSPVANVQATDIANWDQAHGWGDHAQAGYLTSLGDAAGVTTAKITNWDTAYGWGDHSAAGYLTAEADTLATVVARGNTAGGDINFGDNDYIRLGDGTNGDLRIYHAGGAGSYIDHINTSSDLYIRVGSGSGSRKLRITDTSNNLRASFDTDNTSGGVELYHGSNQKKFETTSAGATITGALTAGGLTYPTTNGTSGQVLTSDGAGNVTWSTVSGGGGGGANVTISDTAPGSASVGDLWWESDTGRLKIRYQDTDSTQWVDTSPPLADATTIGGSGTVSMQSSIIPSVNDQYDIGSAEYKVRDLYLGNNSIFIGDEFILGVNDSEDGNEQPEFRKRKRSENHVPKPILTAALANEIGPDKAAIVTHALAWFNAQLDPDAANLADKRITLRLWYAYGVAVLPAAWRETYPSPKSLLPPPGDSEFDEDDYEQITKIGQEGTRKAPIIDGGATINVNLKLGFPHYVIKNPTGPMTMNVGGVKWEEGAAFSATVYAKQGGTARTISTVRVKDPNGVFQNAGQLRSSGRPPEANEISVFEIRAVFLDGAWQVTKQGA